MSRPASLRRRLITGMLGLVALGLVALGALTYVVLERISLKEAGNTVTTTLHAATGALADLRVQAPSPTPAQLRNVLLPLLSTGPQALIWLPADGDPLVVTYLEQSSSVVNGLVDQVRMLAELPAQPKFTQPVDSNSVSTHDLRFTVAGAEVPGGWVFAAESLSAMNKTLNSLLLAEVIIGGLLLLLLAGLGVLVVRRGLRPLDSIVHTAEAITRGDRGQRIPLAGDSEVGRVSAALNQMLDETEASFAAQRASEQQLRQFIADASHELRTPLASVRSYAELLRTGAASTTEDRTLATQRIESEAGRMSELVEDLLLLARLDMGRPLRAERVDLATLVYEAVADENAIDPDRPREVSVDGAVEVSGDANRLRQVLVNLLANARMHTPPGTPIQVCARGDERVTIVVADQGPGLSAEQLTRVFERFYRADAARTHRSGGGSGVGLGLSIVAAIVVAHHGTVKAEGALGAGARFTVTLPPAPTKDTRPVVSA